ncbi:MAG: FAD-binding oxidoreductase [Alphaproteobacteria bacterium]|nr:FAD-binding oxidoreductase [Alphaproteobacteria bacterium]
MTDKQSAISLWDISAEEKKVDNPMDGDIQAEVAIVGGGFTGLSTALHLGEKGIEAHVLEAETIGHGGSGRNAGLLNAGVWLPPQDVRKELGEEPGKRLVQTLGEAPEYVFSLIEKHQIRCEATRHGTIHAAHAPKGFEDLRRRWEEWQRLGAPVDLLDRDQAAEKIGTKVFHGGLLDHRAGTINPMGYVRGLARAATAAGAKLHTGVRVTKLNREGSGADGGWRLETTRGTVTAKSVILGTNAYSDELWPGLKDTFTIIHYFQLATEPMGDRVEHILKERQGLWDTGSIMFSLRRDAFGRLIIGSMGRVHGGESGLSKRWAARRLRHLFPDLGEVTFEKAWHGQIAMTPDHIPRIHKLAEGLYTPIGYNGRGIAPGTIFGRAMAELLTGGSEDDLPLPITEPKKATSAPIMSRLYDAAFTANQVFKSL